MWILWWKLSVAPLSYIDYIHQAEANGHVTLLTYIYGMAIPVLTLTFVNTAVYAYNVRTLVVKELDQDYFMVDLLKGLPDRRVMRKALRTVLPSFLTFTSYNFLNLMINGMAVEIMFNVPGIGATFASGVEFMMFQTNGEFMFFSALVMALFYFINSTIMEGIYLRLDPRVRHDV
ncbi:ABC transporter permease subunit [Thermococcus sp.]